MTLQEHVQQSFDAVRRTTKPLHLFAVEKKTENIHTSVKQTSALQ
jgi:hypothetical protein